MVNVKPVELGKTTRMSFGKIDEVIDMPNLIEIQKQSFEWFMKVGLKEVLKDISGIKNHSGTLILNFTDYSIDTKNLKRTVIQCKERDATYSASLFVRAQLINKERKEDDEDSIGKPDVPRTDSIIENNIYMGELPLMTASGTFVINGAERVIVSQLVRSPGVYYKMDHDKTGKELFSSTVIPNRGAWLEYENDVNDVFYVRIDKNRKIPVTTFIRALGLGTDDEIIEYFGEQSDVIPYFAQSSVYVLPSYREGTPKTVLESMACGRAVITTDAPGCRETVDDKVNGLLVPVKDVDSIVEAMEYLLSHQNEMNRMAKLGRKKAEEVFDVNKVNATICETMGL